MIITLIACSSEPVDTAAPAEAPSAHPYTADSLADPDVAAVQDAVQASLERLMTLKTGPVLDAYAAALTLGTETCPNETITVEDGTTTAHWQEVCTNPDQYAIFNGPMTTWQWEEGYLGSQTLPAYDHVYQQFSMMRELRWTGAGLNGQTDISNALGADYNCSCLALSGSAQDDSGTRFSFVAMDGPSHWTGPETADTWVAEGIQLTLSGYAERQTDDIRRIYIKGSASGLDEDYGAISFLLAVESHNGHCRGWIFDQKLDAGMLLSIRQSQTGHWTDLVLEKMLPDSCTACTEDDTFCLDLTPLVDWEDVPW